MISYIKTFRLFNLFIVILAMIGIRFGVIESLLAPQYLNASFSPMNFFLLALSLLLMAAGGNLINDYFDQNADAINKPGSNLIGTEISEKNALRAYWILTLISLSIAAYLCYQIDSTMVFVIHVFAAISLWFYSKTLQHQWLVGNFIVALLCALVLLLPVIYEVMSREQDGYWLSITIELGNEIKLNSGQFNRVIFFGTSVLAGFAFLITMSRELLKDLADIKGDREIGAATFPIHFGMSTSKNLILVLNVVSIILVLYFFQRFIIDLLDKNAIFWMSILLLAGVITPLIISSFICQKSSQKESFMMAAKWNKYAMLGGILIPFLFQWLY